MSDKAGSEAAVRDSDALVAVPQGSCILSMSALARDLVLLTDAGFRDSRVLNGDATAVSMAASFCLPSALSVGSLENLTVSDVRWMTR